MKPMSLVIVFVFCCSPSHIMVHKISYWHILAVCLFLFSAEKGCCLVHYYQRLFSGMTHVGGILIAY